MVGFDFEEQVEEELSFSQPHPLVMDLNRLHNLLKEKERELGAAQAEIKALKTTEVSKDKAIEELTSEVTKLDEKLASTENIVHRKNLEIKKLINEKKDALAAQYAAEATLRRVYANQKENDSLPLDTFLAPLEAEIKIYKNQIAALQEDKKAMERLTKAKEAALLEAERILKSAVERALIVEEVQNQNYELKKQREICYEENKILEKMNRQKVLEVEKLSQTIHELEEAILAVGAAAKTIQDYKRQVSEINEEKRILERALARAKVNANRVATVVANEWKDENDKVMPVKQYLEERRLFQAEMQRLRDKLAVLERSAKAEAQLKDKFKLRLKTLEEGLKHASRFSVKPDASPGSPKSTKILAFLTSNGGLRKRSSSQLQSSTIQKDKANELKKAKSFKKKNSSGENKLRNGIWASSGKENAEFKQNDGVKVETCKNNDIIEMEEFCNLEGEDVVSGFLFDRLQKEVINLRKCGETKESNLNSKDEEIQMLVRKVDALTKAMEVESKKAKRELAATREKEAASARIR